MNARVSVLREVKDRVKTEALSTDSEERYQALVWVARLLDDMATTSFPADQAQGQTSPSKGDQVT